MKYISTRGRAAALNFEEAVLTGLATDGGLYLPETWPEFSPSEIAAFADLSYVELALRVMTPFVAGALTEKKLRELLEDSYKNFRHPAIAPLVQLDANLWLLELFHGPTLAFKDFALQFLGRLLEEFLTRRDERLTILGATSGDTGSAAIAGCRGSKRMEIFILHPHGRVSDVQRRQMTTILDKNVHNIALEGSFDDCQALVKACFNDRDFAAKHRLGAVNSINWARVMAQVVYYFYAALQLGAPYRPVNFSVPTGNFGDVFAGYVARNMGLPIDLLVVATNRNDILARFLATGAYETGKVVPTVAPSMDIQVASNFERLLFDLTGRDGAATDALLEGFARKGRLTVPPHAHAEARRLFDGVKVEEKELMATIRNVYEDTGMLLDPHSAIGVQAARGRGGAAPLVCLATAHPAKFPDVVERAAKIRPPLPPHMQKLMQCEERYIVLPNRTEKVQDYINNAR